MRKRDIERELAKAKKALSAVEAKIKSQARFAGSDGAELLRAAKRQCEDKINQLEELLCQTST